MEILHDIKVKEIFNHVVNMPFSLSYTEDDTTHTLNVDGSTVRRVFSRYYDFTLRLYDDEYLDPVVVIKNAFNDYIDVNKERFNTMYRAMDLKYNPLYNYDKYSTITTDHTGNITHDNTTNITDVIGESVEHDTIPQTTTTKSTGAYDSGGSLTDSERVTNSGATTSTTHDEHTNTSTNSGVGHDIFNNSDTITERTFGNIGTTQTVDMLSNELEFRKRRLIWDIVDEFMNEYGYLYIASEL